MPGRAQMLGRKMIIWTKVEGIKHKKNTHFELTNDLVSESVWLAELRLCRSESCRDTGLKDVENFKSYPWAL